MPQLALLALRWAVSALVELAWEKVWKLYLKPWFKKRAARLSKKS